MEVATNQCNVGVLVATILPIDHGIDTCSKRRPPQTWEQEETKATKEPSKSLPPTGRPLVLPPQAGRALKAARPRKLLPLAGSFPKPVWRRSLASRQSATLRFFLRSRRIFASRPISSSSPRLSMNSDNRSRLLSPECAASPSGKRSGSEWESGSAAATGKRVRQAKRFARPDNFYGKRL